MGDPIYTNYGCRMIALAVLCSSIKEKDLIRINDTTEMWFDLAGISYDVYCDKFFENMRSKKTKKIVSKESFDISKVPNCYQPLIKDYFNPKITLRSIISKHKVYPRELYKLLDQYGVPYRIEFGGASEQRSS